MRLFLFTCISFFLPVGTVKADELHIEHALDLARPVTVASLSVRPMTTCHLCQREYQVNVRAVANGLARDARVGVRWTQDSWATQSVTYLNPAGSLGENLEEWHGSFVARPTEVALTGVAMRAFVERNGNITWDKNNPYELENGVTAETPVRLLQSQVRYNGRGGFLLTGQVKTMTWPYPSSVQIQYSTDSWRTRRTVEVNGGGDRIRSFSIPLEGSASNVEFAVAHRAEAGLFWDSNHEQNYRHTLQPEVSITRVQVPSQPDPLSQWPTSGPVEFDCHARSEIPVSSLRMRIDDQPWSAVQRIKVLPAHLAEGAHVVSCSVLLEGGMERTSTRSFHTSHAIQLERTAALPRITPHGSSHLSLPPSVRIGRRLVHGPNGEFLTLSEDDRVVRLNPSSGGLQVTEFEHPSLPVGAAPWTKPVSDLVFGQGSDVFGLSASQGTLLHWNPNGRLDDGFGNRGEFELGEVDGKRLCANARLAAAGSSLVILDVCNLRLLKTSLAGDVQTTRSLAEWVPRAEHGTTGIITAGQDGMISIAIAGRLLTLTPELELEQQLTLPFWGVAMPEGMARTRDGSLWFIAGQYILFTNANGQVRAFWACDACAPQNARSLALPTGITTAKDGDIVFVSSTTSEMIARIESNAE